MTKENSTVSMTEINKSTTENYSKPEQGPKKAELIALFSTFQLISYQRQTGQKFFHDD